MNDYRIEILIGIIGIFASFYAFLTLIGKVGNKGQNGIERREKINKYKWIIIISMSMAFILSIVKIVIAIAF